LLVAGRRAKATPALDAALRARVGSAPAAPWRRAVRDPCRPTSAPPLRCRWARPEPTAVSAPEGGGSGLDAATGGGTARRYRPKGLVSRRPLTVD
jgi:hypothetical protein